MAVARRPDFAQVAHTTDVRLSGDKPRVLVRLRVLGSFLELRNDVPATRGDCPEQRPCGHVRCKFHLWRSDALERSGRLRTGQTVRPFANQPELEPRWLEDPVPPSCALDIAEQTQQAGRVLGIARIARIVNREEDATEKLWRKIRRKLREYGIATEIGRTTDDDE